MTQPIEHRGKSEPEYVWVIVRIDGPLPPDAQEARDHVIVKEALFDADAEAAHAEADRLNRLNASKGCHYFAHCTRWSKVKAFVEGTHGE